MGSPNPGPTILPRPVAVAFDVPGNIYVLDQRRATIVVFSRATGLPVRTIGTQGSGPGQMLDPSGIALDGAGNIYVADSGNDRIVRFTGAGNYLGAITQTGRGLRGVAVTPDGGRIYTTVGNFIRIWSPDGSEIDSFGGSGRNLGKLNTPAQLTLDQAGNVWVADRGNNRVQQFGPDGERLAMVGRARDGHGAVHAPDRRERRLPGHADRDGLRQQPRPAVHARRARDAAGLALRGAAAARATRRRRSCRRGRCPTARRSTCARCARRGSSARGRCRSASAATRAAS